MKDHASIRRLLPLVIADALGDEELQSLEKHLRECPACAAELEQWQALGKGLRELPTPQAPAQLVARTRAGVEKELASRGARSLQHWLLAAGVVLTWALTLASWPLVRLGCHTVLHWLGWRFDATWFGLAAYTASCWLTAGVAGVLLAMWQSRERGTT